jgi:hypothetical protein
MSAQRFERRWLHKVLYKLSCKSIPLSVGCVFEGSFGEICHWLNYKLVELFARIDWQLYCFYLCFKYCSGKWHWYSVPSSAIKVNIMAKIHLTCVPKIFWDHWYFTSYSQQSLCYCFRVMPLVLNILHTDFHLFSILPDKFSSELYPQNLPSSWT